ncbi:MAG: hypothetical protein ACREKN_01070, partial [Longimicrobiaceae bacterium]
MHQLTRRQIEQNRPSGCSSKINALRGLSWCKFNIPNFGKTKKSVSTLWILKFLEPNFLIQNRALSFTPRGAWRILAESTFGAL